MNDRKQKAIEEMRTEALERILSHLASPEDKPRSAEYPLGGLVHLTGVGQVSVTALRGELARRSAGTE